MFYADVYKMSMNKGRSGAKIRPLTVYRSWMDNSTYRCFPISLVNCLGYGVYFEEDISFVWDGNLKTPAVGISGKDNIWEGRPEGTVSLLTNLRIKTDEDTSILTISVPNDPLPDGISVISNIISTSFFTGEYQIVLKISESLIGKEVTIPAGTNIACMIPLSIKMFDNSVVTVHNQVHNHDDIHASQDYLSSLKATRAALGKIQMWYKRGLDHNGNIIGKHEVDKIKMNVIYKDE